MSPPYGCHNTPQNEPQVAVPAYTDLPNNSGNTYFLAGRKNLTSNYTFSNESSALAADALLLKSFVLPPSDATPSNDYAVTLPYLETGDTTAVLAIALQQTEASDQYLYLSNNESREVPSSYFSNSDGLSIGTLEVRQLNQPLAFPQVPDAAGGSGKMVIQLVLGVQQLDANSSFSILRGTPTAGIQGNFLDALGNLIVFPSQDGILPIDYPISPLSSIIAPSTIKNSGITVSPGSILTNIFISAEITSYPFTWAGLNDVIPQIVIKPGNRVTATTLYKGGLIGNGAKLPAGTVVNQIGTGALEGEKGPSISAILEYGSVINPGDTMEQLLAAYHQPCLPQDQEALELLKKLRVLIPAGSVVNYDVSFPAASFDSELTLPSTTLGPNSPITGTLTIVGRLELFESLDLPAGTTLLRDTVLSQGTLTIYGLSVKTAVDIAVGTDLPYATVLPALAIAAGYSFASGTSFVAGQTFPAKTTFSSGVIPPIVLAVQASSGYILGGTSTGNGAAPGSIFPALTTLGSLSNGIALGPLSTVPNGSTFTNLNSSATYNLTFPIGTTFKKGFTFNVPFALAGGEPIPAGTTITSGSYATQQTRLMSGYNPNTQFNTTASPNTYLQTQFDGKYTSLMEVFTPSVDANWYNPLTGVQGVPKTLTGAARSYYVLPPNTCYGSGWAFPQGTLFVPDQSQITQVTSTTPYPYAFLVDGANNSSVAPYATSWYGTRDGTSVNFPAGSFTLSLTGNISADDITVLVSGTTAAGPATGYNYYELQETVYVYATRTLDVSVLIPTDAIANLDDSFQKLTFDLPAIVMNTFILPFDFVAPDVGVWNFTGQIPTDVTITQPLSIPIAASGTYTTTASIILGALIENNGYFPLYQGGSSVLSLRFPAGHSTTTTGFIYWQHNIAVPTSTPYWQLAAGTGVLNIVTASTATLSTAWSAVVSIPFGNSVNLLAGTVIPAGTTTFPMIFAAHTLLPGGLPLPYSVVVDADITIPQRLILQPGSILAAGFVFTKGTMFQNGIYIPGMVVFAPQQNTAQFTIPSGSMLPIDMSVPAFKEVITTIAAFITYHV